MVGGMKSVLRVIAALIAISLGVVAWASARIHAVDLTPWQEVIAQEVARSTGRALTVDGAMRLEGLLYPRIVADGVTLASAPGAGSPALITAERVELQVGVFPLLHGAIAVQQLTLVGPRLALERDADGVGSWSLPPRVDAGDPAPSAQAQLDSVEIIDGVVIWRDGEAAPVEVRLPHLVASAPGRDAPLEVALHAVHQGLELRGTVTLSAVDDRLAFVEAVPAEASLTLAEVDGDPLGSASLSGAITPEGALDLAVAIEVPSVGRMGGLLSALGVSAPAPDVGALVMSARVLGDASAPRLTAIDASLEARDGLRFTAAGEASGEAFALDVTASGDDLSALDAVLLEVDPSASVDIPPLGAFSFAAHLAGTPESYALQGLRLQADDGRVQLGVTGDVALPAQIVAVDVTLTGAELTALSGWLMTLAPGREEVPLPDLGRYTARARLMGAPEALSASDIDFAAGGPEDPLRIGVSGAGPQPLGESLATGLRVHVDGDDLSPLSTLLGELPVLPPLSADFDLRRDEGAWSLFALEATVGASDLAGAARLVPEGERWLVDAALSSMLLNVDELLSATGQVTPGQAATGPPVASDRALPDWPVPTPQLPPGVTLGLTADTLLVDGETLNAVSLTARTDDAILVVEDAEFLWSGAQVSTRLVLTQPPSASPGVELDLRLSTAEVERLLDAADASGALRGGELSLHLKLNGQGRSTRPLLAGMSGSLIIDVRDSVMASQGFELLGAGLARALLDSINPQSAGRTHVACGVAAFTVQSGVATADRGLALQTDKMNLLGSAVVQLSSEAIEAAAYPYPREGIGVSVGGLSRLVRFEGTLTEPTVALADKAVARTTASVTAAVATGGLTLLAEGLYHHANRDPTPCQTARDVFVDDGPPPAADEWALKAVTRGSVEAVVGAVRDPAAAGERLQAAAEGVEGAGRRLRALRDELDEGITEYQNRDAVFNRGDAMEALDDLEDLDAFEAPAPGEVSDE